ncbi:hypothetical protein MJ560_22755 [Klebsiella pneumoniae]|nr:hypothetical protein MJ560_22755 [Klebsiella pneumoniae]
MCADHGVWIERQAISPRAVTAIQAATMTPRFHRRLRARQAQAKAKVHVIDARYR